MSHLSDFISKGSAKAVGALLHNIYEALQLVFQAQGQLYRRAIQPELISHLVEDPDGVCACPVTFIDEGQAGHIIPPHLSVHSDGLALQCTKKQHLADRYLCSLANIMPLLLECVHGTT